MSGNSDLTQHKYIQHFLLCYNFEKIFRSFIFLAGVPATHVLASTLFKTNECAYTQLFFSKTTPGNILALVPIVTYSFNITGLDLTFLNSSDTHGLDKYSPVKSSDEEYKETLDDKPE